jgi:peroxiredoxin
MKTTMSILLIFMAIPLIAGEGYKVGDKAADFKLKNVDGKVIGLADYPNAKGFVVVFTCNNCPYAKAYQDRIIALDKEYKAKGFPVIAINPNDPTVEPADSYEAMVNRAKEKGYTFPYLFDAKQEVYKLYGATRTPQTFVLERNDKKELIVKYIGAVDDNYQDVAAVKQPYLENALEALLSDKEPDPNFTKTIGCTIKSKTEAPPQL